MYRELGYGRGGSAGKFGDGREMGRGGGSSDRWRRDDDKAPPVALSRPGVGPLAGRRMRSDNLPEWATEEPVGVAVEGAAGSFDDSGKFRAEQNRLNGVR